MNRAVLEACLPGLVVLAVLCAAMILVARLSGARWNWRRLGQLHHCQDGGVQSLAFVLTLPIFLTIVLFVLQISLLMIGLMVVHYSAFAAARSALVWIPAQVPDELTEVSDTQNQVRIMGHVEDVADDTILIEPDPSSPKYQRIRTAAVMACAPIAPSRNLGMSPQSRGSQLALDAARRLYPAVAGNFEAAKLADTGRQTLVDSRLANKIGYSDLNTFVYVEWRDARNARGTDTVWGPTYNPRGHTDPSIQWQPNEAGWQDATTVYVVHRFALLLGPGRWLAQRLVWTDSLPARIQQRLAADASGSSNDRLAGSTVLIPASATMTNEGFKTLRPYPP